MLDRAAPEPAPRQRQRRCLGRAGGEDDLARAAAGRLGDLLPRPLDSARAARPSACTEEALPATSIAAAIAARASGLSGARGIPVEISPRARHAAGPSSSTTATKAGTAGQGASWFFTTSPSRVWCSIT